MGLRISWRREFKDIELRNVCEIAVIGIVGYRKDADSRVCFFAINKLHGFI